MSKTNTAESDILSLIFKNAAATLIGDAAGLLPSAAAGNLYISLHTADPGEAGDQTTSEAAYTSYARVAVARSGLGWTVSGTGPTQVANAALVAFPACTGSTATCTYFGVGTDASGAGKLLYSGALTSSLAVSSGITPQFAINALQITEE
ncbi:MAG: hypothetical protein ABI620_05450 [Chloroflexota bacterium]